MVYYTEKLDLCDNTTLRDNLRPKQSNCLLSESMC